ncbi:MAG: hypothetical protein R3F07_11655 [Opitutaceae bacterium]
MDRKTLRRKLPFLAQGRFGRPGCFSSALSLVFAGGLIGTLHGAVTVSEPVVAGGGRLLFDDYYQKQRSDELFGQGVARGGSSLRDLTNFYSPEATAIPNGTFAFSELIADKFQVEISRRPLSESLLDGVAAYMMVCPVRLTHGGRSDLTETEASILEAFVARGGCLILVANSIPEPETGPIDFAGLNLIAERFGVRFLPGQTDTISIPIANDHPLFDGVDDMIFGNGTTLEVLASAEPTTQVLLESHSQKALGPVAVLATYQRGKVLLFGDAGSFGNAHVFRSDIGQAEGLRQMVFGLLPDGPAPRYGWKEGLQMRVHLKQEQIVSGYPEFMQIFKLPLPEGTQTYASGMRQIDLEASGGAADAFGSRDFVSAVFSREAVFDLDIGASDGRGFPVSWSDPRGGLTAKLLPNGRQVNPGVPKGEDLIAWQAVLLNDAVGAPLRSYALPGEKWTAEGLVSLPHAQLLMSPRRVNAPSDFLFEGKADYRGVPCYLFSRVTRLEGEDWSPDDIVGREFAMQFNARGIKIVGGGQLAVAKYWISQDALLPVHTEVKVSAALWWHDGRFPSRYVGTHDSKNYENWETVNFVASFGRVLTVDFEVQ